MLKVSIERTGRGIVKPRGGEEIDLKKAGQRRSKRARGKTGTKRTGAKRGVYVEREKRLEICEGRRRCSFAY